MTKRFPLLAVALAFLPLPALADDYVIGRGDVVEISVLNVPALHQRVPVSLDGKIAVPLLGAVEAAGLTTAQLHDSLQKLFVDKNLVHGADMTVTIGEYSPVYINGDVPKPGEYAYRAGLTIQKVMAMAGGFGPLTDARGLTPLIEAAHAKGDFGAVAVELAKQKLKAARLSAELADQPEFSVGNPDATVDAVAFVDLAKTETQQFLAEQQDRQTKKIALARTLQYAQNEADALGTADQRLQLVYQQQLADATRARDQLQHGVGTVIRTEDQQRNIVVLQGHLLDVKAKFQQAQAHLITAEQQLKSFDEERRVRLLNDLRDASAEVGKLMHQLEAARDRFRYAGGAALRSDVAAKVVIFRSIKGTQKRVDAAPDTAVLPGDMIEITTPTLRPIS